MTDREYVALIFAVIPVVYGLDWLRFLAQKQNKPDSPKKEVTP